jgi:hypothetical protein
MDSRSFEGCRGPGVRHVQKAEGNSENKSILLHLESGVVIDSSDDIVVDWRGAGWISSEWPRPRRAGIQRL